jgi:citrate lyase subunit beta/citryl-CoA lyase
LIPYRSVLYVPASNSKALAKVSQLDCDAVIFDLEDAIATEAKTQARAQLSAHYQAAQPGSMQLAIRVNRYNTPWYGDDIKLVAELGPDAVVLPKVETAEEIHRAAQGSIDFSQKSQGMIVKTTKAPLSAARVRPCCCNNPVNR